MSYSPDALLDAGLEALSSAHVTLGEVRLVDYQDEWIEARGREVEQLVSNESRGFGIRALVNGAWGYAASNVRTPESVVRCAREAAEIARCNSERVNPVAEPNLVAQTGEFYTPVERDYFEVPLDEKVDLLFRATDEIGSDGRIAAAKAAVHGIKRKTWLATTVGTRIFQNTTFCGGRVTAVALDKGELQTRNSPKSGEGDFSAAGWEFIERLALVDDAERVRDEALQLLVAPLCPEGRRTLIVDGAQLSLQIHESLGHPAELDRALGEEISLAGCSFLRPENLGDFQYGSPRVNIYADSTTPGGPGTFGWDDEGTPAGRWDLVKSGVLVGYLGSQETSQRVPGTVPGALRATSWQHLPIVRMVNVNLAPGQPTLDEMIANTRDGLLVSVNKSWSIDDYRLNFQFSCEVGWEIKNGKVTHMVKNPVYSGITPKFWGQCDAIADADHWRMWGWRYCGKGDPVQLMHVGHGCSPARFQDVQVGNSNAG